MQFVISKMKGNIYFYFTVITASLLVFTAGIAQTWASPVIPKLKTLEDNPLGRVITTTEESLVNALLSIGNTFGPLLAVFTNKYGRKVYMFIITIPIISAYIALAFGTNIYVYYIARFFKGLGVGSTILICLLYVSETSEKCNRGKVGVLSSVFFSIGSILNYAVGPYVSIKVFNLVCLTPVVILLVFLAFIPESPVYLVEFQYMEKAEEVLKKLRDRDNVKEELNDIQKFCENKKTGNFEDMFKSKALKKSVTICFGLFLFRQLSGMDVMLSNMQDIFQSVGESPISPKNSPIIIAVCKTIVTLITSLVVDKFGRKLLLLYSAIGASISIISLSIFLFLYENHYNVSTFTIFPLICMTFFMISCSFGLMPIPWSILGEIFPTNIKSSASSLATSLNFLMMFLITLVFPYFKAFIGLSGGMMFFGVCCALCVVFVWFKVPETKGKSLADVQDMLDKK